VSTLGKGQVAPTGSICVVAKFYHSTVDNYFFCIDQSSCSSDIIY